MPNGMPTIVIISSNPAMTCRTASSQPNRTIQMTLPTTDGRPASRDTTTRRPKGHTAYPASRNEAMPNGIVTTSTQASTPATR